MALKKLRKRLRRRKRRKKEDPLFFCKKCEHEFRKSQITIEGLRQIIDDEEIWIDLCPYCNSFLE